jgi:NAD(P)-dependent dehydrogenase (short-subunit alcohol dehydrogenase family)
MNTSSEQSPLGRDEEVMSTGGGRFSLEGRVALVTGAGQGIGRVFALALAGAGAAVLVADINDRTGALVAEEVRGLGRRAAFVRTDVRVERDVEHAVAVAVSELGGLDVAVNNAWVGGRAGSVGGGLSDALDLPLEEWDFVHGLLLRACFICCRAEARTMAERGHGKIINIASISATIANANVAYCSAKAGVVSLTRRLAAEWGAYNINVNAISPSYTLSPARRQDPQVNRDRIRALHPLGWHERPEDLAGTLIYLASDASDFLTGQDIVVDGGHTLNVWLSPPARHHAPRVAVEEESRSLLHDLDVLGIPHDADGVALE